MILEEPAADDLLLNLIDKLGVYYLEIRVFFAELSHDRVLNRNHSRVADILVVGVESVHDVLLAESENLVEHIVIKLSGRIGELRLADLGNDLVYKDDELLDFFVSEHDSREHILDRKPRSRPPRSLRPSSRSPRRSAGGRCPLSRSAVGLMMNFSLDLADEHAADRSVPRDIRDGKGDGRADHRGDLRRAVVVDRENGQRDVDVVSEILREERSQRSVNDAGGEYRLLARASPRA